MAENRMYYRLMENTNYLQLFAGDKEILQMPYISLSLDILEIVSGKLSLQGKLLYHGKVEPDLHLERDNRDSFSCTLRRWKECDKGIYKAWFFQVYVELSSIIDRARFWFAMHNQEICQVVHDYSIGPRFPIDKSLSEAYCTAEGFLIRFGDSCLVISRAGGSAIEEQEMRFERQLLSLNDAGAKKAVKLRRMYREIKPLLMRPVWLISDRSNKADDNGEVLFSWLMSRKVPVDCYFLLRRDSSDYERLSRIGAVIEYLSDNHYLFQLLADVWISSTASEYVDNPFFKEKKYYRDILWSKKYVFLQHGIIKDNLSRWLGKCNKGLDLFFTASPKEYKMILEQNYFYDKNVVKLTGMARYDRLENKREKIICIMPTWRQYLGSSTTLNQDGIRRYNDSFRSSRYFKFYNALLNDEKLLISARKMGYKIVFMPHPNVINYVDWFAKSDGVEFCHIDTRYEDVIGISSLLVTDYSSVAHDFSYQYKPVIYCQFDKEEFYKAHTYTKGNIPFDYEKHGFGEVEDSLEGTVDRIISYMKNDCCMKPMYRKRADDFYAFHDKNNCERIYQEIMKLQIRKTERKYEKDIRRDHWKHFFPIRLFSPGERVLMYGYGEAGQEFYQQNKLHSYVNLIAVVDGKVSSPTTLETGIELLPLSAVGKLDYDSILIAMRFKEVAASAMEYLESVGVAKERIKWAGDEYFYEDLLSRLSEKNENN